MDEFEEQGTETVDWHETFDSVTETKLSHVLLCPFCNRKLAITVTLSSSDCHRVKEEKVFEKEKLVYDNIFKRLLGRGTEVTVTKREDCGEVTEYSVEEYNPGIRERGRIVASAIRGEQELTDSCWYDECQESVSLTVSGVETAVVNEGEHSECPETWAGPEEEPERGRELYKDLADQLTRKDGNEDELRVMVAAALEARNTFGTDVDFVPLEVKNVTLAEEKKTYERYDVDPF